MLRRENDHLQEPVIFVFDHAQVTADDTTKCFKCKRAMIVDRVDYVNETGLAADAANYFNLKLIDVTDTNRVIANWSTETGQEGALTAGAFAQFTNSAVAGALNCDAGDVLALFLDLTGTQTLPAGRVIVHGRYL